MSSRGIRMLFFCLLLLGLGVGLWQWRERLIASRLVVKGNRLVADSTLIRPLLSELGSPLYGVDWTVWERRLARHPYIRAVRIRPRLPDTWVVAVEERMPVARLSERPDRFLDEEGRLLPEPERPLAGVLWVRGLGPPYTIGLVRTDTATRAILPWLRWLRQDPRRSALVAEIVIRPGPELVLYTTIGYVPVRVEPVRVEEQWMAFEAFYRQILLPRRGQGVQEVDLRYRDQVITKENPKGSG